MWKTTEVLSEELKSEKWNNIDWNYCSNKLNFHEMWKEVNKKTKSIMSNIPEVIIKRR